MRATTLPGIIVVIAVLLVIDMQPVFAAEVVGNGTPASCTNAALINAVDAAAISGGMVTFDCGPNPHTITINNTIDYDGQTMTINEQDLTIDGGNLITLQGTPATRIIYVQTWGFDAALTLRLRNMTLQGASRSGSADNSNGAAIFAWNRAANNEDGPTLILNNVTLQDNTSTLTSVPALPRYPYDYGGAAVYIVRGSLRARNSTFHNNRVNGGTGAAIHGLGADITIENSEFTNNRATKINGNQRETGYAGALYVDGAYTGGTGTIEIIDSTFDGNRAVNQGGAAYINLYNTGSRDETLTIDGSTFTDNRLTGGELGFGGAISAGSTGGQTPITITRSAFVGNIATTDTGGGFGGALGFAQPADVRIGNSTFYQNRAELVCNPPEACGRGRGGAISIGSNSAGLQIINATIVDNYAGWRAGGIQSSASTTLKNTIIANNQAEAATNFDQLDCSGTYGGNNNLQSNGGVACVNGIQRATLTFGDLTDGYLPLPAGGAAIDGGRNSDCANVLVGNVDQRGFARPVGTRCDIGAIEFTLGVLDVDEDGLISIEDALFVVNRTGQSATGNNARADVDGNNTINSADSTAVINAIGERP